MRLFVLILIMCSAQLSGFAQPTNTTVRTALCLPSGSSSQTVTYGTLIGGSCIGGTIHLYYQFYIPESTGGTPNVGTWTLTSGTFDYFVYGPFSSFEEAYTEVETGGVTPIEQSGSPSSSHVVGLGGPVTQGSAFIVEIVLNTCNTTINVTGVSNRLVSCAPTSLTCDDCLGHFQPGPGDYVISVWAREPDAPVTKTSFTYPKVGIETYDGSTTENYLFSPTGEIIDGWQQITGIFNVPANMESFELTFSVGTGGDSVLFDDLRIFPFDGSMMSYVYDPVTLRLVAELDERNYAKLYEYDEEGKLVRVKKETEKGIMTITENRQNLVKKP